jgi:phage tail sheath gpL-like
MASSIVITVKSDENQAYNQRLHQLSSTRPKDEAKALERMFKRLASGHSRATVDVQTSAAAPAAASGSFTLASVIATDACTIAGVTFTFTSSPTVETDVEVDGADNTADAAALAAAINAHSTIGRIVTATSSGAVVTVTCKVKGEIGNFIAISDADSTITTSGAYLTGGTGGGTEAAVSYSLGL